MNPSSFNYQPCQLPNGNNVMINMNGMTTPSLNFSMGVNAGFQQQPQLNIPFGMNNNVGYHQQQPQVNFIPSNIIDMSQSPPPQAQATVVSNDNSSSSAGSSVRSFVAERKPLAPDFVPGPYDVICARGSAAANSPGNLRFRKTIQEFLPEYSKAATKLEKSLLVTVIVDSVRDKTPNGGFIKKFGDRWYEVGDAACREKIGQCIRDQLHTKYKSSTKSKKPRRKELKQIKKKRQQKQQEQKKILEEVGAEPEPLPLRIPSASKDDENEMSLTKIFYTALVDEGLNLDTIFQC